VATEHDLQKNIGDNDMYADFKMLKVQVRIIFSGTVGFRHVVMDVITVVHLSDND
jgi:hypothetical protein